MRRGQPADRLRDITEAGRHLLGSVGYQRTRMADVATAAGLSAGSVYTYVTSKEALLHSVLTGFFTSLTETFPVLPISAPPLAETLEAVRSGLARDGATPVLRAALHAEAPDDVGAELDRILEEMYTMISRLWPVLAVLEKCAEDIPAIQEFYFGGQRRTHLSRFTRYVQRRAAEGRLDGFGDPELSAQVAVEALTWHAWHRLEGFDEARFSGAGSRGAVIRFVSKALVADP
ncbi:MAG: TetR/AcrR family transcriptional regulator [Acidimicrobiales bacterium]